MSTCAFVLFRFHYIVQTVLLPVTVIILKANSQNILLTHSTEQILNYGKETRYYFKNFNYKSTDKQKIPKTASLNAEAIKNWS